MGHDFVYKRAFMWFDNVDKLIEHGNVSTINIFIRVKLIY